MGLTQRYESIRCGTECIRGRVGTSPNKVPIVGYSTALGRVAEFARDYVLLSID
jgi:hypothetical protein